MEMKYLIPKMIFVVFHKELSLKLFFNILFLNPFFNPFA